MHQRKSFITLAAITLVAVFNFWGTVPVSDPGFSNLKVLPKDISSEKMDQIMDGFCGALGVKCGYCHVKNKETDQWNFASDDKGHKEMARDMMRMTAEINSKYFGTDFSQPAPSVAVSCFTCHQGAEHPDIMPKPKVEKPAAAEPPPPPPPPPSKPAKKKKRTN